MTCHLSHNDMLSSDCPYICPEVGQGYSLLITLLFIYAYINCPEVSRDKTYYRLSCVRMCVRMRACIVIVIYALSLTIPDQQNYTVYKRLKDMSLDYSIFKTLPLTNPWTCPDRPLVSIRAGPYSGRKT